MTPKVSVIIAAYNAERYLAQTVQSLLGQTLKEWEAWLVDDGSTDGTLPIAEAFAQQDPRLHILRQQPNKGVSAARNLALAQARADHCAFLDSDDLWHPEKLQVQYDCAVATGSQLIFCPYSDFVTGQPPYAYQDFSALVGPIDSRTTMTILAKDCFLIPSTVMVSRHLLQSLGGFDESLPLAEDWDLWMRIAAAGHTAYGVPQNLCSHRVHGASLSRQQALYFWTFMRLWPRHGHLLTPKQRLDQARLLFRNTFTLEGDAGRFDDLQAMFDAYRPHDPHGYACRLMQMLRNALPVQAFWFVCRYLVIPLAWHFERWANHLPAKQPKGVPSLARPSGPSEE